MNKELTFIPSSAMSDRTQLIPDAGAWSQCAPARLAGDRRGVALRSHRRIDVPSARCGLSTPRSTLSNRRAGARGMARSSPRAWHRWQLSRPFWGGLLVIAAGAELLVG